VVPTSSDTRFAKLVAATLLGCVTAIAPRPGDPIPHSNRNCGISAKASYLVFEKVLPAKLLVHHIYIVQFLRVVFPLPVSPTMTTVSFSCTPLMI
jgi:hypothetical protein